jgi:hypothetical protein
MLASSAIGAQAFVEEALRWLPTDSAETSLPASAIRDVLPTPSERSDPDRAHVLLADDNADMRDYVRQLLSSRWEVEAVADGQAALEAARQRKPDLVVADVICLTSMAWGCCLLCGAIPSFGVCRSFCCRRGPARKRGPKVSKPAPMIIWLNRSPPATWSRG